MYSDSNWFPEAGNDATQMAVKLSLHAYRAADAVACAVVP